MRDGFFRQPLRITFHYDAVAVRDAGLAADDLVLIVQRDGAWQIVDAAVQDPADATFQLEVTRLSSWYGIASRTRLPTAVDDAAWSDVKAKYRR
jgi:hypothetical protein